MLLRPFLFYFRLQAFGVPAGTLVAGANVIALRIMNGMGDLPGGLYDSMAPDFRSGPFDPASSPGQHQTGYHQKKPSPKTPSPKTTNPLVLFYFVVRVYAGC